MEKNIASRGIKSESTSKSVLFSTFFSLIARLLSFVQAMIVSYYFGATKSTDFLFFCVSFTLLLPGLFNNINQGVIIPNAIRIREKKSEDESQKFMLSVYFFYLLLGLFACAVVITMPEEFMVLASKFSRADITENILIVKLIIPTFFFLLTNSYLLNIFDSYHYFTFPMILDMLKSALTILFIIVFGKKYGIASMAAGILIAHGIQFVLLNFFMIRFLGFRLKFKWYRLDKELQRNIFFVVVSQVVSILSQYVAIYLISGLSEGVYTALSYSDRLYSIFLLVFTGQLTTVLGINIIEIYAKGQFEKLNQQYLKYLKVTMTIIVPVCFILAVQAPLIISVLFERGNFSYDSVQLTSIFFKYSILMIPLLLLDRLYVRLIIAKQILYISFIWNVISKVLSAVVVFFVINYIDYRYYGLGLLLVQFIYILLNSIFMVKKQFKFISVYKGLMYLMISAALCFALSFGIYLGFPSDQLKGLAQKITVLVTYTILVLGSYYLIGFITYNREAIQLLFKYAAQFLPKQGKSGLSQRNDLV